MSLYEQDKLETRAKLAGVWRAKAQEALEKAVATNDDEWLSEAARREAMANSFTDKPQ